MSQVAVVPGRVAVALLLGLAACSSSAEPAPGGATVGSPSGNTPDDSPGSGISIAAAMEAFNGDAERAEEAFAALQQAALDDPDALRAEAIAAAGSDDPGTSYAGAYALALVAEEGASMDALRACLASADESERMLAAGGLIWRGDTAAFPVLIDALASQQPLTYRHPPQHAWQFARFLLIQYTDEDMGLLGPPPYGADQAAAAQQAWQDWWASAGASLQFDAAAQVYR